MFSTNTTSDWPRLKVLISMVGQFWFNAQFLEDVGQTMSTPEVIWRDVADSIKYTKAVKKKASTVPRPFGFARTINYNRRQIRDEQRKK